MNFTEFFGQYGLILLLVVLLVFMFWSSRRRQAKAKVEAEAKARQTVPGAEVLLQGGLYGTIVEFDPENLDQPTIIELAPGVEIKVHSQAILRVVTPSETADDFEDAGTDAPEIESIRDHQHADEVEVEHIEPTDTDTDPGSKPQA